LFGGKFVVSSIGEMRIAQESELLGNPDVLLCCTYLRSVPGELFIFSKLNVAMIVRLDVLVVC
jgi:hypothetical protein